MNILTHNILTKSYLRKLKFQYLEQNAKDRYVKSIVSDIDDAPIVTADDNNELLASNAAKKEKLKIAKAKLAEMYQDIRTLSPLVAQGIISSQILLPGPTTYPTQTIAAWKHLPSKQPRSRKRSLTPA